MRAIRGPRVHLQRMRTRNEKCVEFIYETQTWFLASLVQANSSTNWIVLIEYPGSA